MGAEEFIGTDQLSDLVADNGFDAGLPIFVQIEGSEGGLHLIDRIEVVREEGLVPHLRATIKLEKVQPQNCESGTCHL